MDVHNTRYPIPLHLIKHHFWLTPLPSKWTSYMYHPKIVRTLFQGCCRYVHGAKQWHNCWKHFINGSDFVTNHGKLSSKKKKKNRKKKILPRKKKQNRNTRELFSEKELAKMKNTLTEKSVEQFLIVISRRII